MSIQSNQPSIPVPPSEPWYTRILSPFKTIPFLSIAYIANLLLNVLGVKAISVTGNPIIRSCIMYGQFFPIAFTYQLYHQSPIRFVHLLLGILDYLQLLCMSISLSQINIPTYVGIRNCSIMVNVALSFLIENATFHWIQKIGLGIISCSSLLLIYLGGMDQITSSTILVVFSILYSVITMLLDVNSTISLVMEMKLISSFLQMSTVFYYYVIDGSHVVLSSSNWIIMCSISASEYSYYFIKKELVDRIEHGSIYVTMLDIIRRLLTVVLGTLIFQDSVELYVYYCFTAMMIGCIIYYFHNKIEMLFQE